MDTICKAEQYVNLIKFLTLAYKADTLMDICDMLRERRVEGDADVVVDEPSLFNDSPEVRAAEMLSC